MGGLTYSKHRVWVRMTVESVRPPVAAVGSYLFLDDSYCYGRNTKFPKVILICISMFYNDVENCFISHLDFFF